MRDREICDFTVALLAGAITRCRHLVVDTHMTCLEARAKFANSSMT